MKKLYIVRWSRHRITETTNRFYQGTLEDFKRYTAHASCKTMKSIMKKWQDELDFRYGSTYTRIYVDVVDMVPDGETINNLHE